VWRGCRRFPCRKRQMLREVRTGSGSNKRVAVRRSLDKNRNGSRRDSLEFAKRRRDRETKAREGRPRATTKLGAGRTSEKALHKVEGCQKEGPWGHRIGEIDKAARQRPFWECEERRSGRRGGTRLRSVSHLEENKLAARSTKGGNAAADTS